VKRILVIDDDAQITGFIQRILQSEGYEIETAVNGEAAIKLFKEHPFDLFITDIVMPGMDGIELIMKLRQSGKKIIAISGHEEELLETAQMLGAAFVFQKPFNLEEFRKAVKFLMGEH